MTTVDRVTVKCAVCEKDSVHFAVMSTSSFGLPDLDLRPPPLERETLPFTIQHCPSCGYCARSLSEPIEGAAGVVASVLYRTQLEDGRYPQLACHYLCASLIAAESQPGKAGWAALSAAWVCDDEQMTGAARSCRLTAAERFQSARTSSIPFCEEKALEHLVLADVMRRAELFDQALTECDAGLALEPEHQLEDALRIERALASSRDSTCQAIGGTA